MMIVIVHGEKNQGKTTKIKLIINLLLNNKVTIGGFYSEKKIENKQIVGYDLITIPDKEVFPFLNIYQKENTHQIGIFFIDEFTLAEGIIQIKKAIYNNVDCIIIDEIGKLELKNDGWFLAMNKLFNNYNGLLILSIRTPFVEDVINKWQIKNKHLLNITDSNFTKNFKIFSGLDLLI